MIRFVFVLILLASTADAVEPDEVLSDARLEERARDISSNLRCVVCQNASIDASYAGVARDLRLLVRERLVAGDTDAQVYDYVVARYGDYVLFKPFWKPTTYALWLTPIVLAIFCGLFTVSIFRRSGQGPKQIGALTDEEELRLIKISQRHSGGQQ